MSQRAWIMLMCALALASCGKKAEPSGTAATGSTSSSWVEPSTSPPAGPATASAGGAAVKPPETPTAPRGNKPAFPLPTLPAGTPQAGAGGTALTVPGLPGGVQLPANLPPEAVAAMNRLAGEALAGMQEVEERPGLPNWQKLAALLPDQLGGFAAEGAANGATAMAMGMSTTTATRNYRAPDGRTADVTLAGGDIAPIAAMEFAFHIPDEAGPEHVRRMIEVRGKPAVIEWSKDGGRAEARTLVADKFSVIITVRNAADATAAQSVLEALDLAGLARIP